MESHSNGLERHWENEEEIGRDMQSAVGYGTGKRYFVSDNVVNLSNQTLADDQVALSRVF